MRRGARVAELVLVHVNLLLLALAGAALATAARLRWDPSTYVAVRELFPEEYRVATAALCAGGALQALLAHLCGAALLVHAPAPRRLLLRLYAGGTFALVASEASTAAWLGLRVRDFLRSERARRMAEAAALNEHVDAILEAFGWLPLSHKIRSLVQEAMADLPSNAHVALACVALLALAQPLGAALALAAAGGAARRVPAWALDGDSASSERLVAPARKKASPRTAYRRGRIVVL